MNHPVANAVAPVKADAIAAAAAKMQAHIDRVLAKLAEHNMDVNAAYPRPNGNMGREQYRSMMGAHGFALSITTYAKATRSMNEPNTRLHSDENVAKAIEAAKANAAAQYDAFVAKLIGKVGDCDAAVLTGNHVWGKSRLTITKGEQTEIWNTQMILNVSVLGKLFNQFPTRKAK